MFSQCEEIPPGDRVPHRDIAARTAGEARSARVPGHGSDETHIGSKVVLRESESFRRRGAVPNLDPSPRRAFSPPQHVRNEPLSIGCPVYPRCYAAADSE